jgi:hypothetical protein
MRPSASPSRAERSSSSSQHVERLLRGGEVLVEVLVVGGLLPVGADALLRAHGGARQGVEQLAEALQRFAPRQDAHERFQRLAELRIRVECVEVVAGGDRLVAAPLFEHSALVEEQRLDRAVRVGRLLGAQPSRQGRRVVYLPRRCLFGHGIVRPPEGAARWASRLRCGPALFAGSRMSWDRGQSRSIGGAGE